MDNDRLVKEMQLADSIGVVAMAILQGLLMLILI